MAACRRCSAVSLRLTGPAFFFLFPEAQPPEMETGRLPESRRPIRRASAAEPQEPFITWSA